MENLLYGLNCPLNSYFWHMDSYLSRLITQLICYYSLQSVRVIMNDGLSTIPAHCLDV